MVRAMILAAGAESQKVQVHGTGHDFGSRSPNHRRYKNSVQAKILAIKVVILLILEYFDGHHFYLSFFLSSILLLSFNGHRLSFPLYFFVTNLWSASFAILKYSRE